MPISPKKIYQRRENTASGCQIANDSIEMRNTSQEEGKECSANLAYPDENKWSSSRSIWAEETRTNRQTKSKDKSPKFRNVFSEKDRVSEELYKIKISKEMVFGDQPDITFTRGKRRGCNEENKRHARIFTVTRRLQDEGLKPGMFLIMVGIKNVTLSDYEEQLNIIKKHLDSDKTKARQLTFCDASPFHHWLHKTPRNVGIKVEIRSITRIDTVNQNFQCRLLLKFVWQPSRLEIENYAKDKKWDRRNWRPRFEFPNVQEFKCREQKQLFLFDENARTRSERGNEDYVLMNNGEINPKGFEDLLLVDCVFMGCIEINASFAERLELERFPFDTQDLTISLWSDSRSTQVQFIPFGNFFQKDIAFIYLSTSYCSVTNEWDIHEPIIDIETNIFFSSLHIRNKVTRHPNVFFWRMMVPISLITTASLFSFFLDLSVGGERIAYAFTAVLTSVVYQMKIYGDLPNITYMTLLDWYILYCFLFMLGIVLDTGIFTMLFNKSADEDAEDYIRYLDGIMAWVFAITFVVFHAWSFYKAKMALLKEAEKLTMNTMEKTPWKKVKDLLSVHYYNNNSLIETYTTK